MRGRRLTGFPLCLGKSRLPLALATRLTAGAASRHGAPSGSRHLTVASVPRLLTDRVIIANHLSAPRGCSFGCRESNRRNHGQVYGFHVHPLIVVEGRYTAALVPTRSVNEDFENLVRGLGAGAALKRTILADSLDVRIEIVAHRGGAQGRLIRELAPIMRLRFTVALLECIK